VKNLYYFIFLILGATTIFSSCKAYKETVYFQNSGQPIEFKDSAQLSTPEPVLKTGDLLIITVNTITPEASAPFNLPLVPGSTIMKPYNQGATAATSMGALQNFLIDKNGEISFPVIGNIRAAGMTKTALKEYIKKEIYPVLIKEEPIITIRYAEFKVSMLGEFNRPGVLSVNNERISITEAIAQAGDLTIYGQRNNVLLIREDANGNRETVRIDLRDSQLINSPYYFLQQNDVIYVQPNNAKSRNKFFGTAESISISVIGTLISLSSLIITITR